VPPNGSADRVTGGYRVSGRWTFGSGSTHADVIFGGCIVTEGGRPVVERGAPVQRIMLAPATDFEIIDTSHSTGLAGSGSNDYATKDLFVPDAHTLASDPTPTRSAPLYCYFGMFLASWHGIALGLARRAIDAALAVAERKIHIFPPTPILLRDRPHASSRRVAHRGHGVWTGDANRGGWTALLGVPAGASQVPEWACEITRMWSSLSHR
jgi:indole-3-acetate monooxygenase